jgi:uncharacterized protein (TIGR02246 family)
MATNLSAEDRLDIQDLYARYAWALDTGDIEELVKSFLPDGVIETSTGTRIEGRDKIRAWGNTQFAAPRAAGSQHAACHLLIEGDGETCKVKAYWATLTYDQVDETKRVGGIGYYRDTCAKRDGIWYFRERNFKRWVGKDLPWKSAMPPMPVPGKA